VQVGGAKVLITGGARGLGRALVQAALDAGAAKVYAAARNLSSVASAFDDARVAPVELDVTQQRSVDRAGARCKDVDILINSAAHLANSPAVGAADLEPGRLEMETNYWGVVRMTRAFAPHLAARGGGAIVNILSTGALATVPFCGSYCASEAAAWSFTQSARAELAQQRTLVMAAFPGPLATDFPGEIEGRHPPDQVAHAIFAAICAGELQIFPDPMSKAVARDFAREPWAERAFAHASE
jgi:NAD(P)-dependent dehydrogenase (short-subunit alcohol dehydrogenase family)